MDAWTARDNYAFAILIAGERDSRTCPKRQHGKGDNTPSGEADLILGLPDRPPSAPLILLPSPSLHSLPRRISAFLQLGDYSHSSEDIYLSIHLLPTSPVIPSLSTNSSSKDSPVPKSPTLPKYPYVSGSPQSTEGTFPLRSVIQTS